MLSWSSWFAFGSDAGLPLVLTLLLLLQVRDREAERDERDWEADMDSEFCADRECVVDRRFLDGGDRMDEMVRLDCFAPRPCRAPRTASSTEWRRPRLGERCWRPSGEGDRESETDELADELTALADELSEDWRDRVLRPRDPRAEGEVLLPSL